MISTTLNKNALLHISANDIHMQKFNAISNLTAVTNQYWYSQQ